MARAFDLTPDTGVHTYPLPPTPTPPLSIQGIYEACDLTLNLLGPKVAPLALCNPNDDHYLEVALHQLSETTSLNLNSVLAQLSY